MTSDLRVNVHALRGRERGVTMPTLRAPCCVETQPLAWHGAGSRTPCVRVELSSHHTRSAAPDGTRERVYARRRPEESVLYGVVQAELEGFLAHARARERAVPRFVEREFRAFLACGILAHGFVRVRCEACARERLVAFSCKGRGFCPSCGGRRMADTAAHLALRVLPEAPVRQWVLSLPFALRYRLACDGPLTSAVLGLFVRTVFASLRAKGPSPGWPSRPAMWRRHLRAATAMP